MSTEQGIPFWGDSPESWDSATLGGVSIPGVCRISGDGMRLRADRKTASGQDGASVAMLGLDVVTFSIDIRMWTEAHLRAFESLVRMAKPKSRTVIRRSSVSKKAAGTGEPENSGNRSIGRDLVPLAVAHPALAIFGISECVVESVSLPTEQMPGLWTASFKCREFRKPSDRAVSRPSAGKKKDIGVTDGTQVAIKPSEANAGPRAPNA